MCLPYVTSKNHGRSVEGLQASVDGEARGRADATRLKKKLESDLSDLEVALDGTNRARADAEKTVKKLQQQTRDLQLSLEEEQRLKEEVSYSFVVTNSLNEAVSNTVLLWFIGLRHVVHSS